MVNVMDAQLIPAGYKQTEVGVIPEDWRVETLSNVCEKITDGTHDTPKPTTLGVPFLTAIHVKENRIDFESCYYLPKSIHDEIYRRCNPQKNDVLMVNIGAGVATSALVNVDYEFSLKNVALLKPSKQKIIGAYLNSYQSYVKNKVYESLATGGAQPFLSLFQIGQLKISLPTIQEQTAIADALSDVDALIAALEKLINKKSAIKTAAMQQLLTGKKRLPPFDQLDTGYKQTELGEIPRDWELKSLANICSMKSGASITSEGINDSGRFPCYGGNGLRGYTQNFTHDGDFALIGRQGALCGNIVSVKGQFFASEHAIVVTPHQKTNIDWLAYILYRMNLNQYSESSAQPGLSVSKLLVFRVICPSQEEQTAIANFLISMDKDLEALQLRLHKTQQIKQGMMQELLTGKTRLVK